MPEFEGKQASKQKNNQKTPPQTHHKTLLSPVHPQEKKPQPKKKNPKKPPKPTKNQ